MKGPVSVYWKIVRSYGRRAFLFRHNVWPSCYAMSQYHSFFIMLNGVGVTHPTYCFRKERGVDAALQFMNA